MTIAFLSGVENVGNSFVVQLIAQALESRGALARVVGPDAETRSPAFGSFDLIDLGSGASESQVTQALQQCDRVMVTASTTCRGRLHAYAAIKTAARLGWRRRVGLIANRVAQRQYAEVLLTRLRSACGEFLQMPVDGVGIVPVVHDNATLPVGATRIANRILGTRVPEAPWETVLSVFL